MPAIINDFKVRELSGLTSNRNRVSKINEAFVHGISWEEKAKEIETLAGITKQEIIDFVNSSIYKDSYVAIYKEQTQDVLERQKVAKPAITPLNIPKDNRSHFLKDFITSNHPEPIQPNFIDFKKEIKIEQVKEG